MPSNRESVCVEISDLDYDFNFVGRVGGMRIIILILQIVNDH